MQNKTNIKVSNLKKIICIIILVSVFSVLILSGCKTEVKIVNTPTPVPEITQNKTIETTITPAPSVISVNAFVGYDSSYETPEIIGNKGSNIENGGLSVLSDKRIYHINMFATHFVDYTSLEVGLSACEVLKSNRER